jgi:GntR family transcriptional regulator / MocR family aminotransferase
MRASEFNVNLELRGVGPLYRQVAESIQEAISDGRIHPGVSLPGIRDLAKRMAVHHNTVLAALRELQAQGWVTPHPRSGFFVADTLPEGQRMPAPDLKPLDTSPVFEVPNNLASITNTKNVRMDLSDGLADARLAPADAMVRAYHRALRLKGAELLGPGDSKGLLRLREAICTHLSAQRALALDPEQLIVLRSTSMAVSLVAQTLIGPRGGNVAVENPGNPMVWETLRQASAATLHPLPVDEDGVQPVALERLLRSTSIQLLILTPQCQFPTCSRLSAARRKWILDLSRQHRFPILELDGEYDYLPEQDDPPRPLAAGNVSQVFYTGSLSRLLAPGVRVTFLAVPSILADRMAKVRQRMDWQGDPLLEWAISELFLDGEIHRQIRRVRKATQERRDALVDALQHSMGHCLSFEAEKGAMALWIKGIQNLSNSRYFDTWIRTCVIKGYKLRPSNYYDLHGKELAATRLGFTAFTPEELQQAVAQMV